MRIPVLALSLLIGGCAQVESLTGGLFAGGTQAQAAPVDGDGSAGDERSTVAEGPIERDDIDPGWAGARQTIAGLGDPTRPGLWLETPLVAQERPGRVVSRRTGASAVVTLMPSGGVPGSGSRLSLGAMRALLAPIDQLIELDVYSTS